MARRKPARLKKAYDNYVITTGSAGFIILTKNGKRITPRNATIRFNVRRFK